MTNSTVVILLIVWAIILGVFPGFIVLQVFLSKRDNKFVGLILPIITFITSISTSLYLSRSMTILSETALTPIYTGMLIAFIVINIPTAIYLIIYFVCRSKKRKQQENCQQKQLEKMNIQDLG